MPIRILEPEVVAKIAAGEVVERPASVVKELVENALDAGARSVRVEIAAGGCDLIRVADDGRGIPADELLLAVEQHATSKIAAVEDLGRIGTLGFRGEALASMAAVSELSIASRPADSAVGHRLLVSGGRVEPVAPASRAVGTTVTVERLFFNVPARRKFLRSPASEAAQVAQVACQFALAYPEVAFHLTSDGRLLLSTPGSGNPLDAALAVLGREVASALTPLEAVVEFDRPARGVAARIVGLAAAPHVSRPSRSSIWLFVNRRPVRSRTLAFAVEDAYQTLLQVGRHPIAVANLEVPPEEVDVNVHPAKVEVRLLRERLIYGGLRDAVRSAIIRGSAWGKEVEIAGDRQVGAEGQLDQVLTPPRLVDTAVATSGPLAASAGGRRLPILRLMGQVAQTYIVAEGEQGLYLIDQHAAHERVLLERLMRSAGAEESSQLLLDPAILDLPPDLWDAANAAMPALQSLGFRLEPFGERALLVRGIPNELPPGRAVEALEQTVRDLAGEKPGVDWRERAAVALSCRGAVKAGQVLAPEEMRSLLQALEETDITQHCSHGRPTAILLSHSQLEREFGRR